MAINYELALERKVFFKNHLDFWSLHENLVIEKPKNLERKSMFCYFEKRVLEIQRKNNFHSKVFKSVATKEHARENIPTIGRCNVCKLNFFQCTFFIRNDLFFFKLVRTSFFYALKHTSIATHNQSMMK